MKTENRHIAVICNPKSGKGKPLQLLQSVENRIRSYGFSSESFVETMPESLTGFTDLIIMGGDGTINYTINHFRNISIPIGLIRCGTGNDFTELVLGKRSIESYIQTALFGDIHCVDAGECNGKLFLNGAGIGFDGWIVKNLLAKKLFKGKAAYYSTVISLLFFYKEQAITLTVDGTAYNGSMFMLSAANGKAYGGGFRVAPKASITDGLLECVWVKKISLFKRLRYLPILEKGKHLDKPLPFIQYHQAKKLIIKSEFPLHAHLDGEHLMANTFEIKILPKKYVIRF